MTLTAFAPLSPPMAQRPADVAWPSGPGVRALSASDSVHLVGIGGAGMSGLARVMLARGLRVSGCDREDSAELRELRRLGADVTVGHGEAHVSTNTALVVVSPAVPASSPDLVEAARLGVPVSKRAVLLGALVDAGTGVMIAGTHGKSTTTAMTATILIASGLDPTVFVGAEVPDLAGNARHGGSLVVVEADEYDRSFHHGHPQVAVVTTMEHDHPDIYPTVEDVAEAFRGFAEHVRPDGVLLVWAGDPALRSVADACTARVEWFAVAGDSVLADDVDWSATDLEEIEGGSAFEVRLRGTSLGTFRLGMPGRHNVANALAAIAATHHLGVPPEAARAALARFLGVGRRFETVGQIGGITVIDDYAHHPTEIRATISAARDRFGTRRVWAIFQPHTFSRVAALRDEFAAALAEADVPVVVPVFGARETGQAVETAGELAALARGRSTSSLDASAALVVTEARRGDVLLFMGAGDVQAASGMSLRGLARREASALLEEAEAAGLSGDVIEGGRLADYTSLRIGGDAAVMIRCTTLNDLAGWWRLARQAGVPVLVLGRGSNIVASGSGFDGLVLINRCEAWSVENAADGVVVIAESGVTLAALGVALARQGWAGLEAAVGIPGSVGAAVVTNAGAHGWSVGDSLAWAEVGSGESTAVSRVPSSALGLRYRGSDLKGRRDRLVLRCAFRLHRDDPAAILSRIADNQQHRRSTQPTTPSVGSMFKNPPGDFAGRLIEAAGLKGTRVGGAMISDVHGNFFVNTGGATEGDISALLEIARRVVLEQFGVELELEIELLGGDQSGS